MRQRYISFYGLYLTYYGALINWYDIKSLGFHLCIVVLIRGSQATQFRGRYIPRLRDLIVKWTKLSILPSNFEVGVRRLIWPMCYYYAKMPRFMEDCSLYVRTTTFLHSSNWYVLLLPGQFLCSQFALMRLLCKLQSSISWSHISGYSWTVLLLCIPSSHILCCHKLYHTHVHGFDMIPAVITWVSPRSHRRPTKWGGRKPNR